MSIALKGLKTGQEGLVALKLDMTKAYDRVKWTFLEKLGFAELRLIGSFIVYPWPLRSTLMGFLQEQLDLRESSNREILFLLIYSFYV